MSDSPVRGGIYVHVALCRSKCIYCDFYSEVCGKDIDWRKYLDAISDELKQRSAELAGMRQITLYIGGGTPSLIPADLFARMLGSLRNIVARGAAGPVMITETTMEVNPDDVTPERAAVWKKAGVDRISMGVQSLDDRELKMTGRRHDARTAAEAYDTLARFFDNVSLDLMFGLPGQTLESLSRTLDAFIRMRPQHVSAYSLMYEERTVLTRLRDDGKIEEADENLSVAMFRMINDRLKESGYRRYEISNYALPGFESKHNSAYWDGTPYIGLGPSAHSFDGGRCRRWNVADIKEYIRGVENNGNYYGTETLTRIELREEFIMTGLRTSKGIDLRRFEKLFGADARNLLLEKGDVPLQKGLLEQRGDSLCLTDSGVMVSDEIIVELF